MKSFFSGLSHNATYALPSMSHLSRQELVDNKGACNQLMVFAEDADSKQSFANFHATYAGKTGWKMGDHETYICVRSADSKGIPVRIYANKPDHHDDGLEAINKAVAASQGRAKPDFQVFVGRGHSYHADEYLPLITKDMALVHLGSCGGFENLATVLKTSRTAQVISTQATGSMYVNDPLLFSINESIRTTGAVNWSAQQTALNSIGSANKEAYLLPHKNIPAMMQTAYTKMGPKRVALVEIGIKTSAELGAYIKDGVTFNMNPFHLSDGKIGTDEMDKILKASKLLGKNVEIVQTKGNEDKIIISDVSHRVTFKVKLDEDVKSKMR